MEITFLCTEKSIIFLPESNNVQIQYHSAVLSKRKSKVWKGLITFYHFMQNIKQMRVLDMKYFLSGKVLMFPHWFLLQILHRSLLPDNMYWKEWTKILFISLLIFIYHFIPWAEAQEHFNDQFFLLFLLFCFLIFLG